MSDTHVYKLIELTGTSSTGIEDAVNQALARASKTVRNMRWFEVTETRGTINGGRAAEWQVTIKVGFTLDDPT
jgi:flavin-binding protein dodecin